MKTKVISIVVFLSCLSTWAQEYVPMLDTYNEWKLTTCNFGCLTDTYFTDGDTIVDGKSYKILDGYHYISRGFLLREDIDAKQVFIKMYLPSGVEDYLLYDFSLEEGDTFVMNNPITPFPTNGGPFNLDSIRSRVLADNNAYRHFYFSPTPGNTSSTENAIWIEGVGSLSIINAPGGHPNINNVGHLSCSFKNGVSVYQNLDSITKCKPDIVLSVYDVANSLAELIFYKNGSNAYLENSSDIKYTEVFSVSGEKVLEMANVTKAATLVLDTSSLTQGLYLLQVSNYKGQVRTFKFVVD